MCPLYEAEPTCCEWPIPQRVGTQDTFSIFGHIILIQSQYCFPILKQTFFFFFLHVQRWDVYFHYVCHIIVALSDILESPMSSNSIISCSPYKFQMEGEVISSKSIGIMCDLTTIIIFFIKSNKNKKIHLPGILGMLVIRL